MLCKPLTPLHYCCAIQGYWRSDGDTSRLANLGEGLELWRTKVTRGARIVWEVCPDFDDEQHCWKDMIRIWLITLSHDLYEQVGGSRGEGGE